MAHQESQAQLLFRYRSFYIDKSQPLGHGSYGAVYKAKCDQLPCAAKVLHPTILDPNDPGAGRIMDRFRQECAFLESIRHPNIVQYLGVTTDPESRLPVLLMELLDESLTKFLERSQQPLAFHVEVDICHDIALAVAYLHSNDIIHRDLSSNNVLIIAERRAKVTDFGMSKLAGAAPTLTPLTACPGTLAFMPPEALRDPPSYTKKLDCFSEGVMMIQVCTRLWPEPGPRSQIIHDPRSPTGIVEMPVTETERRKKHINMIPPTHPLLPIAIDCVHYQESDRPSSEEICERIAGIKHSTSSYAESLETERLRAEDSQIAALSQQLQEKTRALLEKDSQVEEMDRELQEKNRMLQIMNDQVQLKDRELQEKVAALQEKEIQLQHKEIQLAEERRIHEEQKHHFQNVISLKEVELVELNRRLSNQKLITAEVQEMSSSLSLQLEEKEKEHQESDDQFLQQITTLQEKIASLESQIQQLNLQLKEQEKVTAEILENNDFLSLRLQDKDKKFLHDDELLLQKIAKLQEEVASQELNQQLREEKKITAEIQQTVNGRCLTPPDSKNEHKVSKCLQQSKSHGSEEEGRITAADIHYQCHHSPQAAQWEKQLSQQSNVGSPQRQAAATTQLSLWWKEEGKAPTKMSRGSAVTHGNIAYFMNGYGKTYSYDLASKRWGDLPQYPFQDGGLVVINDQLTAIGGCKDNFNKDSYTNKLLTLCGNWIRKHWANVFPPMTTKRRLVTTVTARQHLIVAGGSIGPLNDDSIATVEVMDIQTLVWSTAASLPHPYCKASAAVCGDSMYILGGYDYFEERKSVLACSLTELLQSSSSSQAWHRVGDTPAYGSNGAVVNGELLAVGGRDVEGKAVATVYKYNSTTNSWDMISEMPTARFNCFVSVLPNNKMVVVGGNTDLVTSLSKVEVASVTIIP